MDNWKKIRLGDIAHLCLGKMLDKEKNQGELHPYLANIHVRWGSFELGRLDKMRFQEWEHDRYGLKKGDIVMCEGGEPGRCAIWKDEVPNMKIQKALHRIRVNENYSPEFVYYNFLLAGRNGGLNKHFIGSTIKHLTGVVLQDIEIAFPKLEVQKKIARTLSTLDAKIEVNQKINAELEKVAKTLYDYWFVQFDFPDAQGKPYKSSGGAMVFSEVLGREVPAGWEVKRLGEEVEIQRGISYTGKEINVEGIPMINLNSFNLDGTYKPDGIKMYSGRFGEKNIATSGELLIAATDVTRNADIIGKAILIPNYYTENLVFSMDIAKIIPNKLPCSFLMYLFNSNHYHNYIKWFASGTIVLHLNLDGLKRYLTEIPPMDLVSKFDSIYQPIAKKICQNAIETQHLTALRDWLLPLLMNGQVRVG